MKYKATMAQSLLMLSLCGSVAHAADVGIITGNDQKLHANLTTLSISKKLAGDLRVAGELSSSPTNYIAAGANIGKEFKIAKVTITPQIGAQIINEDLNRLKYHSGSALVVTAGVSAGLPVTPKLDAVITAQRRIDFNNNGWEGNVLQAGIRYKF
jgi:hypothetical protein